MSPAGTPPESSRELIERLIVSGLSTSEIAAALGRSPRMIRRVRNGDVPGEAYRAALSELDRTGRVSHRPPRRRDATGQIVPVRAPAGSESPVVRLDDPPPAKPARGRYSSSTTHLQGHDRQHEVTAPKSKGKGRDTANADLLDKLRRAAKGQRAKTKRIKFRVTTSDGNAYEVYGKGGWQVSSGLRQMRKTHGGDVMGWLRDQLDDRYPDDFAGGPGAGGGRGPQITGVTMTVWEAAKR